MPAGQSARAEARRRREQAEQLLAESRMWDRGADGEERVGAVLDEYAARRPAAARILHDRLADPARSQANLDHVVVAEGGVFLVDTKNWSGGVEVRDGALLQHTASTRNHGAAVHSVSGAAARLSSQIGRPVVPVLCLTGERSASFGPAQAVQDVTVLSVDDLVAWLDARDPVLSPADVARLAVRLSADHPPAVDPGLTLTDMERVDPVTRNASPTTTRRRRATRTLGGFVVRAAVCAAVLVAVVTAGPKLAALFAHRAVENFSQAAPTPSPTRTPLADAAEQARLGGWRTAAADYESHDAPSALRYVPDDGLHGWSASCRHQRSDLKKYRHRFLSTPDRALTAAANAFDHAARAQLTACIADHPAALHRARTQLDAAAKRVNARYDVLLGQDPAAVTATRVL